MRMPRTVQTKNLWFLAAGLLMLSFTVIIDHVVKHGYLYDENDVQSLMSHEAGIAMLWAATIIILGFIMMSAVAFH